MRAITLWQPWASLIAEGVKTIETRSRKSPWSSAIGETIAVHAAKRMPDIDSVMMLARSGITSYVNALVLCCANDGSQFPRGSVVATCTLTDIVPIVDVLTGNGPDDHDAFRQAVYVLPAALELTDRAVRIGDPGHTIDVTEQRPFGDFAPGRWALLLDDVVKLPEPIPAKGKQGLWQWEETA